MVSLCDRIIMILTKDHTPGSASLGTTNGLAELFQSLAAAAGPIVVSSLFAISAKRHLLPEQLQLTRQSMMSSLAGTSAALDTEFSVLIFDGP